MFSGCDDHQTSADVHDVAKFGLPDAQGAGGACTNAVLVNVVSTLEGVVDHGVFGIADVRCCFHYVASEPARG